MTIESGTVRQSERTSDVQRLLPTWRELNADTSPAVDALLLKLWAETPAWRKLQMLANLNQAAIQLSMMGLRRRFPDSSENKLRRHLAANLLGEELAARVYGPMPS